jgi:hypothetical protein
LVGIEEKTSELSVFARKKRKPLLHKTVLQEKKETLTTKKQNFLQEKMETITTKKNFFARKTLY